MTPAERKAWLASLNVGDEIAVTYDERDLSRAYIRTVTRKNERGFGWSGSRNEQILSCKPNGRESGPYGKRVIVPVTDEVRKAEQVRNAVGRLGCMSGYDWGQIAKGAPDKIARIIAILDETKP